ncbi:MAG: aminotransferase class I/II-fold pyridoxal phosphate-dependent enzyme [Ilumatobacteraceae bacterium]
MSGSMIPPAGEHGGDGAAIARSMGITPDRLLDLSASLNPFAPDITSIATKFVGSLVEYPDASIASDTLATEISVDPRRLVLTNGGSQAIALVAIVLGDGVVVDPEFSLYRRHLRTGDDHSSGLWRSNPASPLGVIAADSETATVWDEAFWPMTMGTWTRGDDTSWRLGSLTKLWACAGLRLGYVIAPDPAGADAVRSIQPRWSVNGLALALLPELLATEKLPATATQVAAHRALFAAEVTALGYAVADGIAPWLLLQHTSGLRAAMAAHGIVVRDCTSFGLVDTHRIALPRPRDLDRVLATLSTARPNCA